MVCVELEINYGKGGMTMGYNLIEIINQNSTSENFQMNSREWSVIECIDQGEDTERCICGKEGIRYCYRIYNKKTNKSLYPIGSSCIKKFNNEDMNSQMKTLTELADFKRYFKEVVLLAMTKNEYNPIELKWLKKPDILSNLLIMGLLNGWEYSFILDVRYKKHLSNKQLSKIYTIGISITERMVKKVNRCE